MIRVLIADDHAVVRQGLRAFLEVQEDMEVVGEAGDGEEAVAAAQRLQPDVALVDLVMPRLGGVEAIAHIRAAVPGLCAIVLTSFGDDDRVLPAIRAGAAGYLLKDVQPLDLAAAIRTVAAGGLLLHPAVTGRVVEELAAPPKDHGLTAREREVLDLLARGLPNKQIARELGMAERTAKAHVSSILAKLDLTDRTQAALYAVRHGLLEPRTSRIPPPSGE